MPGHLQPDGMAARSREPNIPVNDLLRQAQDGPDPETACEILLRRYSPLVKKCAAQWLWLQPQLGIEREDLESELRLAFLKAIPSFDAARGDFSAHVLFQLRAQATLLKRQARKHRQSDEICARFAPSRFSFGRLLTSEQGEVAEPVDFTSDPQEIVMRHFEQSEVRRWVAGLSPTLRKQVFCLYWEDLPPAATARRLGVSRSAISQGFCRLCFLASTTWPQSLAP